jgi:hypothetical protein
MPQPPGPKAGFGRDDLPLLRAVPVIRGRHRVPGSSGTSIPAPQLRRCRVAAAACAIQPPLRPDRGQGQNSPGVRRVPARDRGWHLRSSPPLPGPDQGSAPVHWAGRRDRCRARGQNRSRTTAPDAARVRSPMPIQAAQRQGAIHRPMPGRGRAAAMTDGNRSGAPVPAAAARPVARRLRCYRHIRRAWGSPAA